MKSTLPLQPSRSRSASGPNLRLDVRGASLLAATITALFALMIVISAPGASADKHKKDKSGEEVTAPDKKFKGKLPITELTEDEAILHALNRLTYGPRPGDVERVRQMGLEKWVDQQLDPDSIDDSTLHARLEKYPTLKMSSQQLIEKFPQANQIAKQQGLTKEDAQAEMKEKRREALAGVALTGNENIDKAQQQLAMVQGPNRPVTELSMAKLDRAVYSQRQLEAVMEDFWFNHFNVFANKGAERWLLTSYVRDTIRPRTMGKFDDLLMATAKSPAMLFFLDNWQSVDPQAFEQWREQRATHGRYQGIFRGGFPPAEFPRPGEGAPGLPATAPKQQERGLNENYGREVMELHTVGVDAGYTQQDVIEMAKCLAGWTIREPRRDPEYQFRPEFHAQGKKIVMGYTFNYGGEKDGEEALKMLAINPSTAKMISTELARRFVSDNPPQSLIERMTKDYLSTVGDTRSVLKTMIYSPEFWSKQAYRAKVKTPFELVASTARTLNADISVSLPLAQWIGRMGEPLYLHEPPIGYSDNSATWVNTGALLNRLNFAMTLTSDHMAGANVDLNAMLGEGASTDPETALSRAVDAFLGGEMLPETRLTLEARLTDPQILQAKLDDPVKQVNEGLISGLVLGAPEFQRR